MEKQWGTEGGTDGTRGRERNVGVSGPSGGASPSLSALGKDSSKVCLAKKPKVQLTEAAGQAVLGCRMVPESSRDWWKSWEGMWAQPCGRERHLCQDWLAAPDEGKWGQQA